MPNKRGIIAIGALVSATNVGAQIAACGGAGAAFGITSYQCASCGMKVGDGQRAQFVFQAEPIVLEVAKGSELKAGDVIVAVNGDPIMTAAGSDQFAYPKPGPANITVRRGTSTMRIAVVAASCQSPVAVPTNNGPVFIMDGGLVPNLDKLQRSDIESIEVLKGPMAEAIYKTPPGRDVIVVKTKGGSTIRLRPPDNAAPAGSDPLYIVDGVVVPNAPAEELSGNGKRYGFAITCVPACSRARAKDGTELYRFDAFPPVVALVPGGLAERAGIRIGDIVTKIDGKSILTEDGVLGFFRANRPAPMYVTVLRSGQETAFLLEAR